MTAFHLIRAPVDTGRLARWAGERGWAGSKGAVYDEGRGLHHLVTEIWGPGILTSFRLLVPPRRRAGNLYAYSAMGAEALRTAADVQAPPEHLKVLRLEGLESKPMPADWRAGQRLGFDLRTRPVRRLRRDLNGPREPFRAGSEVDAFLVEALRGHPETPDGMTNEGRTRQEVYLDWLAERLSPAATLDRSAARLVRFRRQRVAREKRDSEGPDAIVHGVLVVADPTAFSAMLMRGVGRHRAYGYGMLLLRPLGRTGPVR